MKMDAEEGNTKQRLDRWGEKEMEDLDEEEKEAKKKEDMRLRMMWEPEREALDMRKIRTSDTRYNRRMYFPKELSIEEESVIEVRKNVWLKVYKRYMEANCNEKGDQKEQALSKRQKVGLMRLLKRVKDGEMVVS